ncbi:MAG TPA: hypothetical protein VG125_11285, partial [Pirellulales bacterium]|nr:hypothetical protein [Pirellulales bacterium]
MTMHSRIRKPFTRPLGRTNRKATRAARLSLEALEERFCPSTFTVTNTLNDGSVGSLPWAVSQANTTAGANTIKFDSSATSVFNAPQTITLGGSQLELSNKTGLETITGPAVGVTISGGGLSRVFQVDAGVTASLSGLTITDGQANAEANIIAAGGGLLNDGTTALSNCTVTGNTAQGGSGHQVSGGLPAGTVYIGGNSRGGGISNYATLSLTNCTVSGNTALGGTGADGGPSDSDTGVMNTGYTGGNSQGGGICNNATLTMMNCTIGGNAARGGSGGRGAFGQHGGNGGIGGNCQGGGIYNDATLTLTNCTVSGNTAQGGTGGGGGISPPVPFDSFSLYGGNGGIGGNSQGAGIYNKTNSTLTNCTLSGNTAQGGPGGPGGPGASLNGSDGPGGSGLAGGLVNIVTATLTNCTVAANSGPGLENDGTATLTNT